MTTSDAPRAGRREWIGLAVLALACLLYADAEAERAPDNRPARSKARASAASPTEA